MREIILIAHNVRSSHNVGSLLRTADGLGIREVFLTGYTPYPHHDKDTRLPHIYKKIDTQIQKTALGAEASVAWQYVPEVGQVISMLQKDHYKVVALEQAANAKSMPDFHVPDKLAVVVGREVEGIEAAVLRLCDATVEIPMVGQKESFNVAVAAAIFLSYCHFS